MSKPPSISSKTTTQQIKIEQSDGQDVSVASQNPAADNKFSHNVPNLANVVNSPQ
jgi:hypothetical protein